MKCRNFEKENKLLLFDILDYLVDQGNMNIWISVSSKKFFTFILDILKTQNDAEIQTKLLQLIQNWGNSFKNKKDVVPNFFKIYNKFQMNGVVFPPTEQPNYYNFILKSNPNPPSYNTVNSEEKNNIKENNNDEYEFEENNNNNNYNDFEYMDSIKDKLKISNFESKYRRLVAFLVNMHNNIKSANVFIDRKEITKLKDPINTIRKGNKTLIDTISSGRLKDEKLMEITLATTEDINQTLEREEELKIGNKPKKFTSYFVLNDIIPIKSKNRTRAKSERKKGILNKRNNFEDSNKYESKISNTNIKNVNDIFDLFSNTNTFSNTNINSNITNNNNQKNNMFSNFYTNQNSNNKFYDLNQGDEMKNLNNNNDLNNYNNNNESKMRQINTQNNNFDRNNNYNNNFNTNNPKNKMIDLFQGNHNMNQQNNNFQNQNFNKQNEFDMYGPAPEVNSNELVNYIGNFNNGNNNNINNNQFQNNNQENNNYNFGINQNNGNNFGNDMGNNHQMTQEEIEREQRLKELDDLF